MTAADELARYERAISRRSVELALERMPDYAARLDDNGRTRCEEDAGFHVRFLLSSLIAGEQSMFVDYARWAQELLARYHVPSRVLAEFFRAIADAVAECAPDAAGPARVYLEAGAVAVEG